MKRRMLLVAGVGSALLWVVILPGTGSPTAASAGGQTETATLGLAGPAIGQPADEAFVGLPDPLPAGVVVTEPLPRSLAPVSEGGYEGMPGYPPPGPPPTVTVPSPGVFEGMSAMEVALAMVPRFEANGWAIAPTTVITAVDLYANNRGGLLIAPEIIRDGGEPDAEFILQGQLRPAMRPVAGSSREWWPYMLAVVDRGRGGAYVFGVDVDLDRLLALLP